MGTTHKVVSACLRVLELGCSVIILGILARFFHMVSQIDGRSDPRLVYAISMAAISAVLTIILLPPLKYSFYCFPIDFALFVCWIVCFALLQDLTGIHTCSSNWFDSYWTVYGDPNAGTTTVVARRGCSQYRVVLALSFIVAITWLISGLLGLYACMIYHDLDVRIVSVARRLAWWKKPKQGDLEKNAAPPREQQLLPGAGPASG